MLIDVVVQSQHAGQVRQDIMPTLIETFRGKNVVDFQPRALMDNRSGRKVLMDHR